MKVGDVDQTRSTQSSAIYTSLIVCLLVVVGFATYSEPLLELVHRWSTQEEYSHGFLIPVIVAWLLWTRRDALRASGLTSHLGQRLPLFCSRQPCI